MGICSVCRKEGFILNPDPNLYILKIKSLSSISEGYEEISVREERTLVSNL